MYCAFSKVVLLSCMSMALVAGTLVHFDASMRLDEYSSTLELDFSHKLYNRALALWCQYAPGIVVQREQGTIPRVIHHIWFGLPLSQTDKELRSTWQEHHDERWQFVLWTDRIENDPRGVVATSWEEVELLLAEGHRYITVDVTNLSFDNRIYFDETIYYGERSDILKWEIVHRIGGMYCDFDCKCYVSFDAIHDLYDFYTGMQPLDTSLAQLGAALFAAKAGHPILTHAVRTIEHDRKFPQIVIKTGPIHFSKSFYAVAGTYGTRDVVFPASYFYPCGYFDDLQDEAGWRKPESMAVHLWYGSWLKPEAVCPQASQAA